MSADTIAVATTRCPDCGMAQGEPCVYLSPKTYDYPDERLRGWMSRRDRASRAGTPMKRAHQGRYVAAREILNRAARKALREERRVLVRPMSSVLRQKGALDPEEHPEPLATYLASVAFDHHGYTRLREWLAENGSIFTENEGQQS